MKRLLLVLLYALPALPATWFATATGGNINAASLWVPTSTGNCTGSGTALTWGNQATGDTFNVNGCAAVTINVDPGGSSVQVTLTNDATNGGTFTYSTATNITLHAHVVSGKGAVLNVTGSTGGGTLSGNVTGGPTNNTGAVNDTHTVVTFNVIGNMIGGSGTNSRGYSYGASTGALAVTGIATGASSGTGNTGLYMNNGTATITGDCVGGAIQNPGCIAWTAGSLTIIGRIIFSPTAEGADGHILFTPAATNYILLPKDASYATGTIDTHATEMPTNPGVSNVLTGTAYGSFTGTLASQATVGYPHVQ